jgi:hypothetical protein
MVFAVLMKYIKFIFSVFKDSRLLQNAKEVSAAVYKDLETWQMKSTCEYQLLQRCNVSYKMTEILEYPSAKISELSNVLTRGLQQELRISMRHAE